MGFKKTVAMDETTLVFVQIVFRHGIRAPDNHQISYPQDPHCNVSFKPFGKGELTLKGRKQCYEFGKELRARYSGFLKQECSDKIVEAHSSEIGRARITMQLVLAGLFPPTETTKIDDNLNWQPMLFHYKSISEDPLFGKMLLLICKSENHPEFNKSSNSIEVIDCIEKKLGWKVEDKQIMMIYDIIRSQVDMGLDVPEWAIGIYPEKIKQETKQYIFYNFTRPGYKKEGGGDLIKKLILDMWKRTEEDSEKENLSKISLFSGHDITIVALMEILGMACKSWPKYMASLTFELHKIGKEYFVKIIFIDGYKDISEKAKRIELQECFKPPNDIGEMWSLSKLTENVEMYFPD